MTRLRHDGVASILDSLRHNYAPEREDRPAPASRLPSWVIAEPPEHILDGMCWCQPTVEDTLDGGHLFIHRRTIDSPRLEDC